MNKLSKSFRGKSSIIIPIKAITRAEKADFVTKKVEIKIAPKHARLPSAVFPCVNGMIFLPNNFPTRLASPSPKARA